MIKTDFQYRVRYRTESFQTNKVLLADNFSCVCFLNKGEVNAYINGNVLIRPTESFSFNENPDTTIETDFDVSFDSDADENKIRSVCAICSYYEQN